ncbi:aminoacyl-tRNA deacylase [Halodesulfurarchaeum formicicum]|uniref:YbaK/aminoacyl-tRNA synthetase-associated domain-containing protein n=1 Tax=Halodesulfurarchaeum formicicum TaxID=1873524 RepID=A0A1J1ADF4_9EURY|nr:YbaK/EbsC family protein [Halodesulfurarchaeum formicicum]APE95751.1 hypothetical protein HSR6_1307 [Halodesulfurarchaeum formicicum]
MDEPTARFRRRARETLGTTPEVRDLPAGTHSAADAAAALDCSTEAIVKSIVFLADDEPVLVYTAGHHEVAESALAAELDAEGVELADPETVEEVSGWPIGGVPPVGHEVDRTLIDPALQQFETIWGGAGTPETVAAVDPADLVTVIGADPADIFE